MKTLGKGHALSCFLLPLSQNEARGNACRCRFLFKLLSLKTMRTFNSAKACGFYIFALSPPEEKR